jgi:hypothetical protein
VRIKEGNYDDWVQCEYTVFGNCLQNIEILQKKYKKRGSKVERTLGNYFFM